jgi:hypothetical protein
MAADWLRLCQSPDLSIDEPYVDVQFQDGRHQRIEVEEHDDVYLLTAFVARQAIVSSLPDLPGQAWLRNRATQLVGFRIDQRRRLIGEAWVPKAGLTAEQLMLYLRTVAVECDRFEYAVSGRDIE